MQDILDLAGLKAFGPCKHMYTLGPCRRCENLSGSALRHLARDSAVARRLVGLLEARSAGVRKGSPLRLLLLSWRLGTGRAVSHLRFLAAHHSCDGFNHEERGIAGAAVA